MRKEVLQASGGAGVANAMIDPAQTVT